MTDLTEAQAVAFIDALEAETLSALNPCPDLLSWIGDCRASPSTLQCEAERWGTYDGDRWEMASLVEYAGGSIAVVVQGDGIPGPSGRGVVMLADGRFHRVIGDPSAQWSLAEGADHGGFATLAGALA